MRSQGRVPRRRARGKSGHRAGGMQGQFVATDEFIGKRASASLIGRAFSPGAFRWSANLGLRPRLAWSAPLVLKRPPADGAHDDRRVEYLDGFSVPTPRPGRARTSALKVRSIPAWGVQPRLARPLYCPRAEGPAYRWGGPDGWLALQGTLGCAEGWSHRITVF